VRGIVLAAALAAVVPLGGCAAQPAEAPTVDGALSGTITVFAAASLAGAFTELAGDFEAANPGTAVELSFAGSSALVTQILEGAPADVFASADAANMAKVTDAALNAGEPVDFATNSLEIAVAPGNPARIGSLADLADPGLKLVVCAPAVPCGAATAAVATDAGVRLSPVSEESSVTDVLGKVSSGEADAGLVYVTDVLGSRGAVQGVPFDGAERAVNGYPIVALDDSAAPEVARAFVRFVTGAAGRAVLADAGFGAP
jgi:molybdate transport system substrate-binding protein